jgi:hypothetical protein
LDTTGHLHYEAKSDDGADRNCQSGEPFQKERVRKQDEVDELCPSGFPDGELGPDDDAQIRHDQRYRDERADQRCQLISPANCPGWSFAGMSSEMFDPDTSLEYFQVKSHPAAVRLLEVGASASSEKSTFLKFVLIVSSKSFTPDTGSPKL